MLGRFVNKITSLFRTANPVHSTKIESFAYNKMRFPLVCSTFEHLTRQGNIFVDKSLLIKDLLDFQFNAYLITRPRRWGKSLNLNMLETFFQADVNKETGIPDFEKQSKKHLFEKLKIANARTLRCPINGQIINKNLIEYQGNFPVIKITFTDPDITSKEVLYEKIAQMLKPSFEEHKYLLHSNNIGSEEFKIIDAYINYKEISQTDITSSLKYLINALHQHYNRRVILLIDEYNHTLTNMYLDKSEYFSDAVNLFRLLLDPIKNNEKILFTVLAGVTRFEEADIFSDPSQIYHDSVVSSKLSEYFGFTETEVDFILGETIKLKPEILQKDTKDSITKWYKGYNIGNQTIYNPWSIMYCLNALYKNLDSPYSRYWIQTGSTELIEKAIMKISTTQSIEELIKYGETKVVCEESFRFKDIETDESSLMLLLLQSGYITSFENNICKIPNYEVKACFIYDFIKAWLKKHIPEYSIDFDFANFENTKKYGDEFEKIFLKKMIYEDYNESFFQTLVVFPFVFKYGKRSNHKIYIEKQIAEKTSIDILLTPKKGNSNSVFLLEIKKVETHESINAAIKESLFQVFNKKWIENVLEKAELPENEYWESFHIRAIVFSPNDLNTKWQ